MPDEFDAMTAAALDRPVRRTRIEIGTAVVPLQSRHPVALLQQSLSTQLVAAGPVHARASARRTTGSSRTCSACRTTKPAAAHLRLPRRDRRRDGRARGRSTCENESFRIHNPMYVTDAPRMPVMLAALGPVMLRIAGARTDGTILWLADEKAIESHIAPRINAAAAEAGRPAPRIVAGVPICLCRPDEVETARARANRVLSEATVSPNYQRLLDQGNANSVADILAAGDEAMVRARLASFRDAGVTDVSVRVLPIGANRDELLESSRRTRELVAALAAEIRRGVARIGHL